MTSNYTDFIKDKESKREDKDNIYCTGISDEEFIYFTIKYLLGDDWYVVDPLGHNQVNQVALEEILYMYSKKFKKGNWGGRMKYRKKPVVIEAVRFMIGDTLPDWFMDRVASNTIITHSDGTCDIKTLEGTMRADYGDYIILGIKGEVYPCKPDIFISTYEEVLENDKRI